MTPHVLLVGCAKLPEGDGDEWQVPDALGVQGITAGWVMWDDRHVDFTAADLVILRATWDYPDRRDEFLAWCDRVPNLRNHADVVRWNTDKTYLIDLAGAGIRTVPTELVRPGELPSWPDGPFVLKPSIGVGSIGCSPVPARRLRARHQAPADLARSGPHRPAAALPVECGR